MKLIMYICNEVRLSLIEFHFKTLKPFLGFGVRADELKRLFLLISFYWFSKTSTTLWQM